MSDASPPPLGAPAAGPLPGMRTVAAMLCGLEALALVGVAVFYVYELVTGVSSDALLVLGSAAVVVLAAAGLGVLARGWRRWTRWPRTPTIVWHLLLVPVAVSLLQAGRSGFGWSVLALAVVALLAAFSAPRPDEEEPPEV